VRGISASCESALRRSQKAISRARHFDEPVEATLKALLAKSTNPNAQIYVTGYARFWNSETEQCSNVSWTYSRRHPTSQTGPKMSKERRRQMNDLVDQVNAHLARIVRRLRFTDKRIRVVDYDAAFETHRFCEEGVVEPQREGEVRKELYMYQYRTKDVVLNGTGWNKHEGHPEEPVSIAELEELAGPAVDVDKWLYSRLGKVFHPTTLGYSVIADRVIDAILTNNVTEQISI
jgi:hypothetical protein